MCGFTIVKSRIFTPFDLFSYWQTGVLPFASMKRTLSIRLSHEADRNCIESVVSLFVNKAAAYSKQFMGFVYIL
jgi:hypothetical protein